MSGPAESTVAVNGNNCRVWSKGDGAPIGVLAGFGGFVEWSPFLEALSASRRTIVPSLPGFPGGDGHRALDDLPDWIAATLDLLEGAGLDGADLVGLGPGGLLAAEVAAFSRPTVKRLILVAPLGLFDAADPVADVWGQRGSEFPALMSSKPEDFAASLTCPDGADEMEWQVVQTRASEAAARLLWPTGDLGLHRRLHRITAPTLLVWGADDRVVPARYADRFATGISGSSEARVIQSAGHRVDFDAPDELAQLIVGFLT